MGKIINGFYEFENKSYTNYGKVKDFCFIKNILERVVVDVITNKNIFLNDTSKGLTKEMTFKHPNIPNALESSVFAMKDFEKPMTEFKYEHQCKNK